MSEFHVGFSGSRDGVEDNQRRALHQVIVSSIDIRYNRPNTKIVAHHGDCLGADVEFDGIMRDLGAHMIIHPPKSDYMRAYCFQEGDEQREEKDYLDRDDDIVIECAEMFFCPKTFAERRRSGTWTTIRYARKRLKSGIIVYPDGTLETIWNHG